MSKKKQPTYSKEALLAHFDDEWALVSVLLDDNIEYTIEEVEQKLNEWKGEEIK